MSFRNLTALSILSTAILLLASCVSAELRTLPAGDPLARTLEAHGGLDRWSEFGTFAYTMDGFPLTPKTQARSRSTVDLRSRRNRIVSDAFVVAFDGTEAWSTPGADASGLPDRFFSLGSFYFIGMPFVFADPGVVRESIGATEFRGRPQEVVRITYVDGVGHSDEDDYVVFVDAETARLTLIHHSVTEAYDDGRRVTWIFDDWQRSNGLLVPSSITFHPSWNDSGELPLEGAVTRVFDVELARASPNAAIYANPATVQEGARTGGR